MASCTPDYPVVGMQNGEQVANMFRLAALCISLSVFHPWLNPARRQHMRIFCLHWASGVAYVVSQFIMSVMVLNCWSSKRGAGPAIYMLKFIELTALNLWAISSLAIALLIATIVQAFSRLRRVPGVIGSRRTIWLCVSAAIFLTCLSAPFWDGVLVTGAYFWVTNTKNAHQARWISLSFLTTQAAAGVLMALTLIFTVTGSRRASLRVCCKTSKRVKTYFVLTILGTCVYLYNAAVLLTDEFSDASLAKRKLIMIGWCSKYLHVIADTFVLFNAFGALDKANGRECSVGVRDGLERQAASGDVANSGGSGSRLSSSSSSSGVNRRVISVSGQSGSGASLCPAASGATTRGAMASSRSSGSVASGTTAGSVANGNGNGEYFTPLLLPPAVFSRFKVSGRGNGGGDDTGGGKFGAAVRICSDKPATRPCAGAAASNGASPTSATRYRGNGETLCRDCRDAGGRNTQKHSLPPSPPRRNAVRGFGSSGGSGVAGAGEMAAAVVSAEIQAAPEVAGARDGGAPRSASKPYRSDPGRACSVPFTATTAAAASPATTPPA